MSSIVEKLKGQFVLLDLGSSSAKDNKLLNSFSKALTIIELDALSTGDTQAHNYYRSIKLKKGVSPTNETKPFFERASFYCSSFLTTKDEMVKMYGQEDITRIVNTIELECITVPEILESEQIGKVDFFKTDLEGLDFEIIKSAKEYVKRALVLQTELRFQPYSIGEPYFFEVCEYVYNLNFELIKLSPETWKYKTKNQHLLRDGRIVWGDFVFFRKLNIGDYANEEQFSSDILKQILVAKSLELSSHAEYLFEQYSAYFSTEIRSELAHILKPKAGVDYLLNLFFNGLSNLKGYGYIRNFFYYLSKKASVDRRHLAWWTKS